MKQILKFIFLWMLCRENILFAQVNNYFGVNFTPQSVWLSSFPLKSRAAFGFSAGVDYLNEINPKISFEVDILYSQQKGFGIPDTPLVLDPIVNPMVATYLSSTKEKLKFLKIPFLCHYKINNKATTSIIVGGQPQYFLKQISETDKNNIYYQYSISFMCGAGYIYPVLKKIQIITQLRIEYSYKIMHGADNLLMGLMIGIIYGKTIQKTTDIK